MGDATFLHPARRNHFTGFRPLDVRLPLSGSSAPEDPQPPLELSHASLAREVLAVRFAFKESAKESRRSR
jgi:hypothetical protein